LYGEKEDAEVLKQKRLQREEEARAKKEAEDR
jgi:hypothetical protein